MKKPLRTSISLRYIFKTAVLTVLGMISFFLLMNLLGLHTISELRYFNFLFVIFAVRHILIVRQNATGGHLPFNTAMMMGFLTVFFKIGRAHV